jgi:hypothetical protein
MDETDTTNQVVDDGATSPGEDTEAPTGVENDEGESSTDEPQLDEPQLDEDGNPITDQAETDEDDEFEEIEEDGKRAKIPSWLKPRLMMHADYTRKTQEVAALRRDVESTLEQVKRATADEFAAVGNLTAIRTQYDQLNQSVLQKYGSWEAFHESDPFEAGKAEGRARRLQEAYTITNQHLAHLREQRTLQEQQATAKRLEEGKAELERDIPGWSAELAGKLEQFAQKEFGFSQEDLSEIYDPRIVKMLHAAYQWRGHQSKQQKARNHLRAQQAQPAAKASSGGNPVPPGKLDDRLSPEEWMRRRNAQLAKRG